MPLTPRRAVWSLPSAAVVCSAALAAALLASGCKDVINTQAPPVCPDKALAWVSGDTLHAALLADQPDAACWNNLPGLSVPLSAALGSAGIGDDLALMHGSIAPQSVTATVKAIYTQGTTLENSFVYVQVSWTDPSATHDAGRGSWHFGSLGSTDPMAPAGWSQWGDDDKLAIMWPIGATADSAFSATGCAYACHMAAPMKPSTGGADVWYWKAGGTGPIAFAEDWNGTSTVNVAPDADRFISSMPGDIANKAASGGPGLVKQLNALMTYRPFGDDSTTLDSTLYLLATASQVIEGRATLGDSIYVNGVTATQVAACITCHAGNGKGVANHDLTQVGRSWSLERFQRYQSRPDSTGHPDFRNLNVSEQRGLLARLRAFTNIPRRSLNRPTGSTADLRILNWDATYDAATHRYTIIFKRKLSTGFDSDRVLDPAKAHPFALAVMDRDAANHSGSQVYYLDFRQPIKQ